jgi:hypothetical protein
LLRDLASQLVLDEAPEPPSARRSLEAALDATLHELREAFHRRGRLSSRNEAVDEVSKLLFAHFACVTAGRPGLSQALLVASDPAATLLEVVRSAFAEHLPASLTHEIAESDFALRLKPAESDLALEIARAFGHLDRLALSTRDIALEADVLNGVFSAFLADSFVDERQLGQYLTPPEIVQFMVDVALGSLSDEEFSLLTDPQQLGAFGCVLDPSCGVGSFLTATTRALIPSVVQRHGKEEAQLWLQSFAGQSLVGIDKSERMVRLALTSLALLSPTPVHLHLANGLAKKGRDGAITAALAGKAGLILTNPPFGAEFRADDLSHFELPTHWAKRVPAKVDSELLFLERYLEWLRPGGRVLAIVPDSVLTNRGLFHDLRRALSSRAEVEVVVSLPAVTFSAAGTTTKTSVLQLRRADGRRPRRSYVAICSDVGYSVGTRSSHRQKRSNGDGDLPLIATEILPTEEEPTTGRFIPELASFHRWDATYHASLPSDVRGFLETPPLGAVFVRDVAQLSAERADPRRWAAPHFTYIEISDVDGVTGYVQAKTVAREEAPSRARKKVRTGDVLVSTVRPERRTVGVVSPELAGAVCSTGFAVLRPIGVEPYVLAALLRTDFAVAQILRNNVGIAYPAIEETCLLDLLLPVAKERLNELLYAAEALTLAEARTSRARDTFRNAILDAVSDFQANAA